MKIIAQGTVFAGEAGTDRQSCAFPAVAVLPSGRWLCGFRAAPAKTATAGQHALVTWSDDEGRSWSAPARPCAAPMVDGKPGALRAAHPTALGGERVLLALYWVDQSHPGLAFFNQETQGLLDSRIMFAESPDGGATWSRPELMDTSPFNVPTPITGPVLALRSGEWACQFELNKHYYDTSAWRHSSVLMFSRDEGKSWPEYSIVTSDPENRVFYWDQRPTVLADGAILDLFWTYDTKLTSYRNIHARRSGDHGRTWGELWDTGVRGQPAPPVSAPGGGIVMVYVDRTGAPAIKARVSRDGGRTWPAATELTLYRAELPPQTVGKTSMQDAWAEMGRFSVGLPATAALPDGEVVALFYAGPETDHTDVRWARLRP